MINLKKNFQNQQKNQKSKKNKKNMGIGDWGLGIEKK